MIFVDATVTLSTAALNPRDRRTPLTAADVTGVTFSIFGPGNVELVTDEPMTWDDTIRRFVGEWTSPDVAGDYLACVVWHGVNGSRSPAWQAFRVEPNPTI